MRTGAVLMVLAVGLALACDDEKAPDGGNDWEVEARAWIQRCAPDGGPTFTMIGSCWSRTRPGFALAFWRCMNASPCTDTKADERCAGSAVATLTRSAAAEA